jgi:hypothetical protein
VKKFFAIALFAVLALLIALPVATFASDPIDTVTITWNGGGLVAGNVNATGDQVYNFAIGANITSGSFTMNNLLDNPYGYGVNSTNAEFIAMVNGGSATYTTTRTDSYVPMYGAAGQATYSYIFASDGTASMAMWNNSNYAAGQEANYGHAWTPVGDTFSASAGSFQIIHTVTDSEGDYSGVNVQGSGTASLDCMSSDIGAGGMTFGKGAGCYTDASYDGVGDQLVQFVSVGHSLINQFGTTITGDGSAGSASLAVIAEFVGTFSVPDFSATVQ